MKKYKSSPTKSLFELKKNYHVNFNKFVNKCYKNKALDYRLN